LIINTLYLEYHTVIFRNYILISQLS